MILGGADTLMCALNLNDHIDGVQFKTVWQSIQWFRPISLDISSFDSAKMMFQIVSFKIDFLSMFKYRLKIN